MALRVNSILDLPKEMLDRKTVGGKTVYETLQEENRKEADKSLKTQKPVPRKKPKPVFREQAPRKTVPSSTFVILGKPAPAPRQTKKDSYDPSPMTQRYREWGRTIWKQAPRNLPQFPLVLYVRFYLPMPEKWKEDAQKRMWGQQIFHRQTPDSDNFLKAIKDALFDPDACIAVEFDAKFWCRPGEERAEVTVHDHLDPLAEYILEYLQNKT